MSHLYYWAPGVGNATASTGGDSIAVALADDHYFRLGAYVPTQEPSGANIGGQGIYFYTSGKYSLKSTAALHQAVAGPVTRVVQTEDLTYTNEDGNLSITVSEGAVKIAAEGAVHISSAQETSDDSTTITIDAGDKDVYFRQGKYYKLMTNYEEKIVEAFNHKTNIGLLITTHIGAGVTASLTCELTYSTFSISTTAMEVSVKGIALSYESDKSTLALASTESTTLIEGKKVVVDEEFCWIKNETKRFRFTKGISQALVDESCVRAMLNHGMDEKEIIADFKTYGIVI